METRSMEIKIVSARDLNNVNFLMKMDVFVVLKLIADGDSKPKHKSKTPVDKEGGHNPNWNFSIKFPIDEFAAKQNRLTLVFTLRCQRNLGDRDIGQVFVPVKELLDSSGLGGGENSMKHLSYQISKPSGNPQGVLNFSYRFDDKPVAVEPPPPPPPVVCSQPAVHFPPPTVVPEVYPPPSNLYPILPPKDTAPQVPVAVPAAGYGVYPPVAPLYSGYMPVHSQYGYQHQTPPPPVYGYESYPPPPPMYGYPPSAAAGYGSYPPPERKKSNMGMGLGLGAGLVGGVLIGDFMSEAAGAASYDTGFGDTAGFDF